MFPETHWSQILRAGDAGDPRHREHLERLLSRYWKPVYHYIRAMRPLGRADAEDLTQGFFAMVLARVDFATLTPERGTFRGFLKTALRRHVLASERKVSTQIERRHAPLFPFAEAEADLGAAAGAGPGPAPSPEEAFDRAWARELLAAMLARLERELEAEGKTVPYRIFREYCLDPAEGVTYEALARRHGVKEDDVRNHLRAVRQRGRDILREMVSAYLLPGESVEDELRFVLGA